MALAATIRHRLDLAVRLIDTTSGNVLGGAGVEFLIGGKAFRPLQKADGNHLFLGIGREDFDLTVRLFGFEEKTLRVSYGELDQSLPRLEAHMIPNRHYQRAGPCFTLEGTLAGLSALDAVKIGDNPCQIREFDERKRIMTLFNPHHLDLSKLYYAVVDPDEQSYEAFTVEETLTAETLRIDRKLTRPFGTHCPVARRVFGSVGAQGQYLLRVRDDSREAGWMVRYTVDGREYTQIIDFKQQERQKLDPGQARTADPAQKGE